MNISLFCALPPSNLSWAQLTYLNALDLYEQADGPIRFRVFLAPVRVVSAAAWVNGGHLGLAGASVNGAGERHSARRTAPRSSVSRTHMTAPL